LVIFVYVLFYLFLIKDIIWPIVNVFITLNNYVMLIKKKRKEVSGLLRNKLRTKERLIAGIGQILEEDTFTGLSVTRVFKKLHVNPKLVYLYFESFDNLVNTFLRAKLAQLELEAKAGEKRRRANESEEMLEVIIAQIEKFHQDGALKKLIHWSLVEKKQKLLNALLDSYVNHFRTLFRMYMKKLSLAERKRLIALLDVLLSGTFFLSVHSSTGEFFLGLNMDADADRKRIYDTFRRILLTEVPKDSARLEA